MRGFLQNHFRIKTKIFLFLFLLGFVGFCGALVIESGLFEGGGKQKQRLITPLAATALETSNSTVAELETADVERDYDSDLRELRADNAVHRIITLGSTDKESGFKFELELSSRGAAIRSARLSEHVDLDPENPQPLLILSPAMEYDGTEILSMAHGGLIFIEQQLKLPLQKLDWSTSEVVAQRDGSEKVVFETIIKNKDGRGVFKLTKSYVIGLESYNLECRLTLENLTDKNLSIRFDLQGPIGINREGQRGDLRKVVAGFMLESGQITTSRLDIKNIKKAANISDRRLEHKNSGARFIWAAIVNKYFAAILRPVPEVDKNYANWVSEKTGSYYESNAAINMEDTIGLRISTIPSNLEPRGSKTYNFELYLGPKDKNLFSKNELYRNLGYIYTIDFMTCCFPAAIIRPLAFGILALMEWLYGFIGNYGIVIIILVFLIRIAIHPLTKKSQVSMLKFSKLAPKLEEIKKKYANNKGEQHKQIMQFYREQGISPTAPITGMLPMIVQMPIWISLYSAIYTSVSLRGAAFLPFWITDLSSPDALFRFPAIILPLFGKLESFNLLPILMGVAFYLQQKLMPHAATSANPQAAQQQKMMMIMMPVMFPLLLYKAPSGLNLYIMSSVFAGVIEQYVIRKHIREKEELVLQGRVAVTSKTGGRAKKKKPKPFYRS